MKYAVCVLAFLLLSCSTPGEKDRINYELVNETEEEFVLTAGTGWLQKKISLKADETWKGWLDPSFFKGKTVRIVVRKEKP